MVPDKVPGLSEGLPRHQGAHPVYSRQVTRLADDVMSRLLRTYGTPDKIPDDMVRVAAVEIRDKAWAMLRNWTGQHLE